MLMERYLYAYEDQVPIVTDGQQVCSKGIPAISLKGRRYFQGLSRGTGQAMVPEKRPLNVVNPNPFFCLQLPLGCETYWICLSSNRNWNELGEERLMVFPCSSCS